MRRDEGRGYELSSGSTRVPRWVEARVRFVALACAAFLTAAGALAIEPDPNPDLTLPDEIGTPEAEVEITGADFLSYFLPDQHADPVLNGDRPNFYVKGWAEQVSDDCGPWCSGLTPGVQKRTGLIKTMELTPNLPCDREFILIKGSRRLSYEHYCVVGQNVFLQSERGYSLAARSAYRRFRFNVNSVPRDENVGYVWVRANQTSGQHFTNRFRGKYYTSCGDVEPDDLYQLTAPVFFGPYTLSNPVHRARLISVMGDHADAAVDELMGLADEMNLPDKPVKIIVRREFWGRYATGNECLGIPDKWPCFAESEDYIVAKVGKQGLGRVGWQKRHADVEGEPHHVQKRSISANVVWEEGSRIVPRQHCGLLPEQ